MFKELNILERFMEEPVREFNVRELARIINKAPATVSKKLQQFAKKGILLEKEERRLKLYKANQESELYRDIKLFATLRAIKDSGLIMALNKFYLKPTIILFGSAAKGMDTEVSDIDILIISEKIAKINNIGVYEKKLKRTIQVFTVKDIKGLKNKHLINNVLNGISIQGCIQWT